MKRFTYFFIGIGLSFFYTTYSLQAQIDRSKRPAPGEPPVVHLAPYEKITLKNGLTVLLIENHKLPRVSFQLVLDHDPVREKKQVGLGVVTGELLRNGTKKQSKQTLDEAIDLMGAYVDTYTSGASAGALSKYTAQLMAIMAEVIINPAFPKEAFDRIIKQQHANLQRTKNDPSTIAWHLAAALGFGKDHPYGEITTDATLDAITLADCQAYYQKFFIPNKAYLVITGDIDKKNMRKLVKRYFGTWKKRPIPTFQYALPTPPLSNVVALVDRPQAVQSVIGVGYPIDLKPTSPDLIATELLAQLFGGVDGRLFNNLREQHGFTYGAYGYINDDQLIGTFYAGASVRNEVTDSAMAEIFVEMKKIIHEKVDDQALQAAKNYLAGKFSSALEYPKTHGKLALNIERYGFSKDHYQNYLQNLARVTVEDIYHAAKKYILPSRCHVLIVGNVKPLAEKLKTFGPLTYYNDVGDALPPTQGD